VAYHRLSQHSGVRGKQISEVEDHLVTRRSCRIARDTQRKPVSKKKKKETNKQKTNKQKPPKKQQQQKKARKMETRGSKKKRD